MPVVTNEVTVSYQTKPKAVAWLDPALAAGTEVEVFAIQGINGHFHCMLIERNQRKKGVLHFILFRYPTIVAVLGWGHSCRTMACSCV